MKVIKAVFPLLVLFYFIHSLLSSDLTDKEIADALYEVSDESYFLRDLEIYVLRSLNDKRRNNNLNKLKPKNELYAISLNESNNKFETNKSIKQQCYEAGFDTINNDIGAISYKCPMNYDLVYDIDYPKIISKIFINKIPKKDLQVLLGDQDIASCGCVMNDKIIYCTITAAKKDFRLFAKLF